MWAWHLLIKAQRRSLTSSPAKRGRACPRLDRGWRRQAATEGAFSAVRLLKRRGRAPHPAAILARTSPTIAQSCLSSVTLSRTLFLYQANHCWRASARPRIRRTRNATRRALSEMRMIGAMSGLVTIPASGQLRTP